ncbi:MAG: hypothetical protein E7288_03840 [Lachnospiraceae bacterium]|nr:hypothetical protein [Lachnospiraceae bacterium]
MNGIGFSICVSGYDSANIQKALSKSENGKTDLWSLISSMFKVIPKESFESILVYVFRTGWMKAIVLAYLQKRLVSADFCMLLKNIIVKSVQSQLEIYVEVSNVTYEDIYKLLFSYEGECENPYFHSVIRPVLQTVDKTLPNDMKICLLVNIVNNCRNGLCRLLEEMIKTEYGVDLVLEELCAEIIIQYREQL